VVSLRDEAALTSAKHMAAHGSATSQAIARHAVWSAAGDFAQGIVNDALAAEARLAELDGVWDDIVAAVVCQPRA